MTSVIQQSLNKHAPLRKVKTRSKPVPTIPWFNKEIEEKKKEKNKYLQLFYKFGDVKDKFKSQKMNNELNHMKEKSRKQY